MLYYIKALDYDFQHILMQCVNFSEIVTELKTLNFKSKVVFGKPNFPFFKLTYLGDIDIVSKLITAINNSVYIPQNTLKIHYDDSMKDRKTFQRK